VGNIAIGTEQFVGRQAELKLVEEQLFGAGALGVITALRGIGGRQRVPPGKRLQRPLSPWEIVSHRV
jgi:hypothetical protein